MSKFVLFGILCAGLIVAGLIAARAAKGDFISVVLWLCAGAVPGASLLVGENAFMLSLLVFALLLWWRARARAKPAS